MSPALWLPAIDANGACWPVITSALLDERDGKDRVRLFNRGTPLNELLVEPGDGAALLQRLGMEPSKP
jgi:hypothetical protein